MHTVHIERIKQKEKLVNCISSNFHNLFSFCSSFSNVCLKSSSICSRHCCSSCCCCCCWIFPLFSIFLLFIYTDLFLFVLFWFFFKQTKQVFQHSFSFRLTFFITHVSFILRHLSLSSSSRAHSIVRVFSLSLGFRCFTLPYTDGTPQFPQFSASFIHKIPTLRTGNRKTNKPKKNK
jgi:hypothetical protein